jgi:hypothetical protein
MKLETTELTMSALQAVQTQPQVETAVNTISILTNPTAMDAMFRFADLMAAGVSTVPKHLQGKPADCMAIVMQASRWGMDPFAVGQKTHLVNGVLGYEAQLVNAVLQTSGAIRGRFHYEYRGEGERVECRVGAIPMGEADIVWGEWLCAADVTTKNSPLWKTNKKQQLGYLQVKNWGRQYAPGAILGVYTADELVEMPEREINPMDAAQAEPVVQAPKSSLKSRTAKAAPIEAEVVVQQQEPVNGPDFGDDDEPEQFSPEVQSLLNMLIDCYEDSHFKEWKARTAGFAKNSPEFISLVGAYNARRAELKTQAQGE